MKIQVLGGHGGQAKGFGTTSYLIDDKLLVDAGAVASALEVSEQARIDHILISHSHLDHIKDLAFLCDNCFGMRATPFTVHTHETVKQNILKHLFNEVIWPDFTQLPTKEKPTMQIVSREPEKTFEVGGYQVTPVPVNHPHDTMGFIIEKDQCAVLFTLDTGPTERIWELGAKFKNLKAIFTEVSFPNALHQVAEISQHHTPQTMADELKKMPEGVTVILTHFKPNFRAQIITELQALKEPRLRFLESDGETFHF